MGPQPSVRRRLWPWVVLRINQNPHRSNRLLRELRACPPCFTTQIETIYSLVTASVPCESSPACGSRQSPLPRLQDLEFGPVERVAERALDLSMAFGGKRTSSLA